MAKTMLNRPLKRNTIKGSNVGSALSEHEAEGVQLLFNVVERALFRNSGRSLDTSSMRNSKAKASSRLPAMTVAVGLVTEILRFAIAAYVELVRTITAM